MSARVRCLRGEVRRLQQFFGRGAQIPILAIDGMETIAVGVRDGLEGAHNQLATDLELAGIGLRKYRAGKKLNGEPGAGAVERAQILRHGGSLGEFAARGGQRFA